MNLNWFYAHCIAALAILYWEYNGTLEDRLNKFEEKIGIYTPPIEVGEDTGIAPPRYIPPTAQDSTFILSDSLRSNNE